MKLLILSGVNDAGKSTTIRHATKYLAIKPDLSKEFVKEPYKNMRKRFMVGKTPVYIYCSSPQEVAKNKDDCRGKFKRRIQGREQDSVVIMPFNLESKYEERIEACLQELDRKGSKIAASFVFLNAEGKRNNDQAKIKIAELKHRGYLIVSQINRLDGHKDEQGKNFAVHIKGQLP